jgi:hypothetical protein
MNFEHLVDVRYGVIVDVEATSAHRTKEVDATRTMIDRVERRFKIKPKRLIGHSPRSESVNIDMFEKILGQYDRFLMTPIESAEI